MMFNRRSNLRVEDYTVDFTSKDRGHAGTPEDPFSEGDFYAFFAQQDARARANKGNPGQGNIC